MKSNNLLALIALLSAMLLLSGCMSTYYNRYGGVPLGYEILSVNQGDAQIRLMVSYRHITDGITIDKSKVNIAMRVMVEPKYLDKLKVDKITLSAIDGSYLYSFANPIIYDQYGKHPLSRKQAKSSSQTTIASSYQPVVFTVDKNTVAYQIIVSYEFINPAGAWETTQKSIPLDISDLEHKDLKDIY